ncbi:MAG: hypothetical protein AAF829_05560 [Pseudomonadota bacterium]
MVKKKKPASREDRLASALRANLRRRKQALRQSGPPSQSGDTVPETDPKPE